MLPLLCEQRCHCCVGSVVTVVWAGMHCCVGSDALSEGSDALLCDQRCHCCVGSTVVRAALSLLCGQGYTDPHRLLELRILDN